MLIAVSCLSQSVINRIDNFVLIDAGGSKRMQIDDECPVYRDDMLTGERMIGKIRIIDIRDGNYFGEVIEENDLFPVSRGDHIQCDTDKKPIRSETPLLDMFAEPEKSAKTFPIVRVHEAYVLINAGRNDGLRMNQVLPVKRRTNSGKMDIGTLRIIRFQHGQSAGKIISEKPGYHVTGNDIVELSGHFQPPASSPSPKTLRYGSLGLGIAAVGIGYYYYQKADQTYTDYQSAATASDAVRLYDESVSNAKRANYALGIGGGLILFSLLHHVIFRPHETTYPARPYSVQPFRNPHAQGLSLRIALNQSFTR